MKCVSLLSAAMLLGTLGARLKPGEKAPPQPAEVSGVSNPQQDLKGLEEEFAALDARATPSAEEREEAATQAEQATQALHTLHQSMVEATKSMKAKMTRSPVRKLTPGRARRASKERLTQLYHTMEQETEEVRTEELPEFQTFLAAEAELWRSVEEKAVLTAEAEASQDDSEKAGLLEAAAVKASDIGELGRAIRVVLHYFNRKKGLLNDVQIEDMIKAAAGEDWEAAAIAQDEAVTGLKVKYYEKSPELKAATGLLPVEDMMDPENEVENEMEDDVEDMIEADLRAAGRNMLNAGQDWDNDPKAEDEGDAEDASASEPASREQSMQFEHSNMIASEIEKMLDEELDLVPPGPGIPRSMTNDEYFDMITEDLAKRAAQEDVTAEDDAAMVAKAEELSLKD